MMIKAIIFDFGGVLGSDAVIYPTDKYMGFKGILDSVNISLENSKKLWRLSRHRHQSRSV